MKFKFDDLSQEETNLIVTGLDELCLKAIPSQFRNQLLLKLQAQAQSQVRNESKPKENPDGVRDNERTEGGHTIPGE